MSINGTAGLFFLPPETTMNGQKYLDLLKNKLELHMARDVAAAPQTPQLGGAQANFGGPS